MEMTIQNRITELNLSLPNVPKPSGNYDPFVFNPPYLYVSGITCKQDGVIMYKGKVGKDLTKEEGYAAARLCLLNQLSIIQSAIGDLDRIEQIVKLVGFVNIDGEFNELPAVINGASDLLVEIFGDRGRHARSAVGVASLPGGAAVEVEMIVKVKA